jgi:PAS domain S-box-containing protein
MQDLTEQRVSAAHQKEAFHLMFDQAGFGAAVISLDGSWLAVNPLFCEALGYSRRQLLRSSIQEVTRFDDTASELAECRKLLKGKIQSFVTQKRHLRPDGRVAWLKLTVSLLRDEAGEALSFLAFLEDMTAVKNAFQQAELERADLARRLMSAQEAERARIARELHDGIGQSLALLNIQLQRTVLPPSSERRRPGIQELSTKLKQIGQQVSRLSHQLHSSELEFLGLAVAVRGLCREFSEQYKIKVDCKCTDMAAEVEDETALCVLRVVQEALHNVAKHSQATSVQVEVVQRDDELALSVIDDGVGFEVNKSRKTAGLGLVSMRERMYLIGGQLTIRSTPGKGTRIQGRVPLKKVSTEIASAAAG